jgi:CspA family cold shock protein
MSIFRDTKHPWSVKKQRSPVSAVPSLFRRFPGRHDTVEPEVPGRVKWFSRHRGYGFIETNEASEVFVHFSSITGSGYRILETGDKVVFDLVKGPKGYQALNVRRQTA